MTYILLQQLISPSRFCQLIHRNISVAGLIALTACSAAPFQLDSEASRAGLQRIEVSTGRFEHLVYKNDTNSRHQVVFIEGDGTPWTNAGQQPAADPGPRTALAFELMRKTPATSYYVTRPCYFGLLTDSCSPELWTSARYSEAVVNSMRAAIEGVLEPDAPGILVGHSAGPNIGNVIMTRGSYGRRLNNVTLQYVPPIQCLLQFLAFLNFRRCRRCQARQQ